MSFYHVKERIPRPGNENDIPILKPDHVSLGKCVTSMEFIRTYATVQSVEVVNMLRDGCRFKGFKKLNIESAEEEGFANMHHVIMLESNDDERRIEVCVQRKNFTRVNLDGLKLRSSVVTNPNSVVIVMYNPEDFIEFFYFGESNMKQYHCHDIKGNFSLHLLSDAIYVNAHMVYGNATFLVKFKHSKPYRKYIKSTADITPQFFSSDIVVYRKNIIDTDGQFMLLYDDLNESTDLRHIKIERSLLKELSVLDKMVVININGRMYWVNPDSDNFSIYLFISCSEELNLCKKFDLNSFYPQAENFIFVRSCVCISTQQLFLLYIKTDKNLQCLGSFIVVIDMKKLAVISILSMELTLNRKPSLFMYPSRDGSKLFVQETFENRVIFYQVFSLLPSGLTLENITKQFIWKTFPENEIRSSYLPNHLIEALLLGV